MTEAHVSETAHPASPESRSSRRRRKLTRALATGGIVVATLAVAGPSWAGPQMGC